MKPMTLKELTEFLHPEARRPKKFLYSSACPKCSHENVAFTVDQNRDHEVGRYKCSQCGTYYHNRHNIEVKNERGILTTVDSLK